MGSASSGALTPPPLENRIFTSRWTPTIRGKWSSTSSKASSLASGWRWSGAQPLLHQPPVRHHQPGTHLRTHPKGGSSRELRESRAVDDEQSGREQPNLTCELVNTCQHLSTVWPVLDPWLLTPARGMKSQVKQCALFGVPRLPLRGVPHLPSFGGSLARCPLQSTHTVLTQPPQVNEAVHSDAAKLSAQHSGPTPASQQSHIGPVEPGANGKQAIQQPKASQ